MTLFYNKKEIKSPKGKEYKINERKAIGIFKEKYIKTMLIKDKRKAIKELDLLEKEIEKYVSIVLKK